MNWKSPLLKPVVALAIALLATASWSEEISEEQEGSKLYCVKQVQIYEGYFELYLSQHFGDYTPDDGEECFEQWSTSVGGPSAYASIENAFKGDYPPRSIVLTSDIDFGGYDEGTGACNEQFRPFEFNTDQNVQLMSMSGSYYTISGLCYISKYGVASFGGNLISTIQSVRFKNLHLESSRRAGLLGAQIESAVVSNVYVENASVSAPVAGLLASKIANLTVNEFSGSSVTIHSVPQMDLTDVSPDSVAVSIGGLAGDVEVMQVYGTDFLHLYVINNVGDENYFSEYTATRETHLGGIVGKSSFVDLARVNIDESIMKDNSESMQIYSYVGGLVGAVREYRSFKVNSTSTYADVQCSKDTMFCKVGYIVGLLIFGEQENPGSDFSIVSNYHYTENSYDMAIGMVGSANCAYAASAGYRMCVDAFNKWGELPIVVDSDPDEPIVSVSRMAYGNYRSANEDAGIEQTSGFDSESYTFSDANATGFSVGFLDNSNMKKLAFAEALNEIDLNYGSGISAWNFDDDHDKPYMMVYNSAVPSDDDDSGDNGGGGYDQSEEMAYVFFGTGMDYEESIVGIFSYEGETVENRGTDIDVQEYSGGSQPVIMRAGPVMRVVTSDVVMTDGSEFKGWKVRAAMWSPDGYDVLRNKAFAGIEIPIDEDGYFSLYDRADTLVEIYQYAVMGECAELSKENPTIGLDSLRKLSTICEPRSEEFESIFNNMIIAIAVYPVGFEDENELEGDDSGTTEPDNGDQGDSGEGDSGEGDSGDSGDSGHWSDSGDSDQNEISEPTLFQSGNAVQFVVNTDDFSFYEEEPFIVITLENDDGDLVDNATISYDYSWPQLARWTKYPLAPGYYLLTANIFNGREMVTREWDFEVSAQIAATPGWHMISLSNVDFDDFEWDDDALFYWWDEFSGAGTYWQYREFTKKDSPEQGLGYWYNSIEGRGLKLNTSSFTESTAWKLDSVNSGWNLVANPYGWYLELGVEDYGETFDQNWFDEQMKWLEEEARNREDVDEEWLEEERRWLEEEMQMHKPAVEFSHWDSIAGQYEPIKILAPYEAVWVKVNRPEEVSEWQLAAMPAFVTTVNDEGEAVLNRSLKKKMVLAKFAGTNSWSLQAKLSDNRGKMDSWNMLGVAKKAWNSEEPPAGMGDRVNLSIVESGKRLAKSVKAVSDGAYEWNVELSATSGRTGFLELSGLDALAASGLSVYVTVDGKTTKMSEGTPLQIELSTTPKVARIYVGKAPKVTLAKTLGGLKAVRAGTGIQVSFDASAGLAGARSRVDIVDMRGKVVATAGFTATRGTNVLSFDVPRRGLYFVRAACGSQVAVQKFLLK